MSEEKSRARLLAAAAVLCFTIAGIPALVRILKGTAGASICHHKRCNADIYQQRIKKIYLKFLSYSGWIIRPNL